VTSFMGSCAMRSFSGGHTTSAMSISLLVVEDSIGVTSACGC
jgi:hypothetical protein